MKRKMLVLVALMITLSLIFVGCGQDKGSESNTSAKVNQEESNEENNGESKDESDKVLDSGKLILGLDDSFPPMGFRDDKGEIVGFDIDLAKAVTEKLGLELVLKPVDWSTVTLTLNKGDIDVIWNGFSVSEKRKKEVDFSDSYLDNKQIMVVKNDSNMKGKEDLKDKVLGIQSGSTSEGALAKEADVENSLKEIKKYADNVQALMDLGIGRVDVVLVDEVVGRYYVAKKPGEYKILEENFGKEEYAIGIKKGNDKLREKINEALAELREDGTESKISEKWFGEDIIVK